MSIERGRTELGRQHFVGARILLLSLDHGQRSERSARGQHGGLLSLQTQLCDTLPSHTELLATGLSATRSRHEAETCPHPSLGMQVVS